MPDAYFPGMAKFPCPGSFGAVHDTFSVFPSSEVTYVAASSVGAPGAVMSQVAAVPAGIGSVCGHGGGVLGSRMRLSMCMIRFSSRPLIALKLLSLVGFSLN